MSDKLCMRCGKRYACLNTCVTCTNKLQSDLNAAEKERD